MAKLKKIFEKKTQDVVDLIQSRTDNGISVINNGSRAIGTPFTVIAALSVHEPVQQGGNPWLGWDCAEKNARGTARVVTPNGLGQFGSYPEGVDWQGDTSEAFIPEGDTFEDQIKSMENWLDKCDGAIKVVAKAKHPRFEGQWMYAYGVAE